MSSKPKIMNMIGFIFLTYRRQVQKELNEYDITFQQVRILRHLTGKKFLYPSEIADLLFCDRPTASVVIRNMERKSWIKKEKDTDNGKQIKISLTDDGRKKVKNLGRALMNMPERLYKPEDCFTEKELEKFEELLYKFWIYMKSI